MTFNPRKLGNKIKGIALVGTATTLVSVHSMAGIVEDATSGSTVNADIASGAKFVLVVVLGVFGFRYVKSLFSR